MPIYLNTPNVRQDRALEEFQTPFRSYLRAKFDDALSNNFLPLALETDALARANRGTMTDPGNLDLGIEPTYVEPPKMTALEARNKAAMDGIKQIDIPEAGIPEPALDILIARKKRQMANEDAISRSPTGLRSIPGFGVALAAGILDPVNVAASFVPVIGQARYALALERATGAFARAGVRASVGGVQGAVGTALIEPFAYAMHKGLQDDYKMLDSLMNIGFGGLIGGTLHVGGGAIGDVALGRYARAAVKADEGTVSASTAVAAVERQATPIELRATGRSAPDIIAEALKAEERRISAENTPGFLRTAEDKIALEVGQKPSQLVENVTPELERAFEIAQKPGALRSAEEKIFLEAMQKGGEPDYLNARLSAALGRGDATEAAAVLARFSEIGRNPNEARLLFERLDFQTRDAAVRTAIAQSLEGKYADLEALIATDPKAGIAAGTDPVSNVRATAERQNRPEATRVADPRASALADRQIADAPKTHDLAAAQAELAQAETQLRERAAAANVPRETLDLEFKALDETRAIADEYAKAAKAATLCGI